MKARIKHLYQVIAGAILSLLGFSGCDQIGAIINPVAEYGMPTADYKLIGEVEGTDGPLEGIQVRYRHFQGSYTDENGQEQEYWLEEDFITDKNGRINDDIPREYDVWPQAEDFQLVLTDIDGEKNGLYKEMVIGGNDLNFQYTEDKNGRWHWGSYIISFAAKMQKDYMEFPNEYGCPHADYRVIGTVKDANGSAIPGIEVLAAFWEVDGDNQSEGPVIDTQTTADGTFEVTLSEWPGFNQVKLVLNDIDGEQNGGQFKSAEASASFTQVKEGDGHWNEGSFEADAGDIVLKK